MSEMFIIRKTNVIVMLCSAAGLLINCLTIHPDILLLCLCVVSVQHASRHQC